MIHAHRPEMPLHAEASDLVRALAEGADPWAIPVHCLVEFAGVVSQPRIWAQPSDAAGIGDQIAAWRESPSLRLLTEDDGFWPVFVAVMKDARVSGGAVHDARIAACCRHHGVRELFSIDRDFGRYPWLSVRNPLVGGKRRR